ncbi:hypothetical protein ACFYVL_02600 [Streptomyces sp. NPDC004111]|uniref:hypothetical protein n=1 Tax=Streptomyces sp. NPDC004111 TaxID=3364690 RepID=UPI0036B04451
MDDAFTLLRHAADLLPRSAVAESGATADDVDEYIEHQEWETALALLLDVADVCRLPESCWEMLAEAARQMALGRTRRWCEWRRQETVHGTVRARLTLRSTEEGGRRTPFAGDGRLRPLWDLAPGEPNAEQALHVAVIWVESARELGPGETADIRLAPLRPEHWRKRDLKPGDTITMHEGRPAVGTATITEILPPGV